MVWNNYEKNKTIPSFPYNYLVEAFYFFIKKCILNLKWQLNDLKRDLSWDNIHGEIVLLQDYKRIPIGKEWLRVADELIVEWMIKK